MTHVREMDEMIQGERERLELRLTEAMDLLKRYREALNLLVTSEPTYETMEFCPINQAQFKRAKESLVTPLPEWMKEYLTDSPS